MHEFEELEQVVLATLEPLRDQGVKTLDLYAGQAEAEDIEELARMTLLFPCVYVVATGLALTRKDRYDEEDIGIMLLELTEALLHRKKIHSSGVMLLRSAAPLYLAPKKGLCFYAARYEFKTIKT